MKDILEKADAIFTHDGRPILGIATEDYSIIPKDEAWIFSNTNMYKWTGEDTKSKQHE